MRRNPVSMNVSLNLEDTEAVLKQASKDLMDAAKPWLELSAHPYVGVVTGPVMEFLRTMKEAVVAVNAAQKAFERLKPEAIEEKHEPVMHDDVPF